MLSLLTNFTANYLLSNYSKIPNAPIDFPQVTRTSVYPSKTYFAFDQISWNTSSYLGLSCITSLYLTYLN
jgi:hypothetical protein